MKQTTDFFLLHLMILLQACNVWMTNSELGSGYVSTFKALW
jgi:hypothetical protein